MPQLADRVEDQEGDLLGNDLGYQPSPDGSHDQVGLSPAEQAAFDGMTDPKHFSKDGKDGHDEKLPTSPTSKGNHEGETPKGPPKSGGTGTKTNAKDAAIGKAIDKAPIPEKQPQGKTADAADKAAATAAEAALVATGVGTVAAGAVGSLIQKIGVKRLGKNAILGTVIMITLILAPIGLLFTIFGYVVTHPAKAVEEVLLSGSGRRFALTITKKVASGAIKVVTGAQAYETNYKAGQALAAPVGQRPEPGTLLDLISKVDYKKSQFQFQNVDCPYDIKTKEVVAFDGKTRSVIDKVVDRSGNTADMAKSEVASCVIDHYPLMEALARSPEARKVNKQMNVALMYAEPKDSPALKGKTETEIGAVLHKKTLERVWKNNGESTECNKNLKPGGTDAIADAIAKTKNDLLCGTKPEDINLSVKLPSDVNIRVSGTVGTKARTAMAITLCTFNDNLVIDDNAYNRNQTSRYKSTSRAGLEALTLADTGLGGDVSSEELNGDFYKFSGFASSRAYNYTVNGSSTGKQIDPEALGSRLIGLLRDDAKKKDAGGVYTLQELCDIRNKIQKNGPLDSLKGVANGGSTKQEQLDGNALNLVNVYTIIKGQIRDASNGYFPTFESFDMQDVLIRTIKIVNNISNAGTEDGPDNFSRMMQGTKTTFYNYSLSLLGSQYQDEPTSTSDAILAESISRFNDQHSSLASRLFNTKNVRSLASQIASGFTARPKQIAQTAIASAVDILNPIKSYARVNDAIAYYGFGQNNRAMAASDDDISYWRLDTSGVTTLPGTSTPVDKDMLGNARIIEGLKKTSSAAQAKFAAWDTCMSNYYPSKELLMKTGGHDCMVIRGVDDPAKSDPNEKLLAARYAAYKGDVNLFTAWAKLSSDEKDNSIYAGSDSSSAVSNPVGTTNPPTGTGPNGSVRVDPAKSCTGGPQIGTVELSKYIMPHFQTGDDGIYNCRNVRGGSSLSLHAEGRAFDAALNSFNPAEKARGDQLFNWAIQNAVNIGAQEVIWNHQIWTPSKGVHAYTGTNPHTDHVHIGQNWDGALSKTPFYTSGAGK